MTAPIERQQLIAFLGGMRFGSFGAALADAVAVAVQQQERRLRRGEEEQ
jgi:hypothetical protein